MSTDSYFPRDQLSELLTILKMKPKKYFKLDKEEGKSERVEYKI